MRTLILFAVCFALHLRGATLLWDANPTNDNVLGYKPFWGTNSRAYFTNWDVGTNTSFRIRSYAGITNWYAVTAYNDCCESDFSLEVTYWRPFVTNGPVPITLMVPSNKWQIVAGPNVASMTNWFAVTGPTNIVMWSTNGPMMFMGRKAFFTQFASLAKTAKGGAAALMPTAKSKAAAKPKAKAKPVPLGPPAPAASPPQLPGLPTPGSVRR